MPSKPVASAASFIAPLVVEEDEPVAVEVDDPDEVVLTAPFTMLVQLISDGIVKSLDRVRSAHYRSLCSV